MNPIRKKSSMVSSQKKANEVCAYDWINIKERLPELDKLVLIVDNAKVSVGTPRGYSDSSIWWDELCIDDCGGQTECTNVTHWMPLPDLPRE